MATLEVNVFLCKRSLICLFKMLYHLRRSFILAVHRGKKERKTKKYLIYTFINYLLVRQEDFMDAVVIIVMCVTNSPR